MQILANGAVGLFSGAVGAVIGAKYTLWLQDQRDRVRRINDEVIYVEYSVIKADGQGLYIPGYGRILDGYKTKEELPGAKEYSGKLAYYCTDRSAANGKVIQYAIHRYAPL